MEGWPMTDLRKAKPTEGEWFVDEDEPDFTISSTGGVNLCRVLTADDFPCRDEGTDDHINAEALANARVMAAAPALREAVRLLQRCVSALPAPTDREKSFLVETALRAAIEAERKAEEGR
jgi:hypothetical protein